MKIFAITLAIVLFIMLAVAATVGIGYISANNEAARMENSIIQLNKDSENKLSTYTTKIMELVQIPSMYKKDLNEVIKNTFEGRYGDGGSKAVMQWIQEQNIPLDSKLYLNLQNEISAGRNEFQIAQTRKLEQCTKYRNQLAYVWKGTFMSMAGYPKINLDKVCEIVSDSRTQEIFSTGVQSPIKLN